MGEKLKAALTSVPWSSNVETLCENSLLATRIENCGMRLAHWARQIETIEKGNPAIPFVREMQHGGHNVAACISLALYKPAASSMRSLLECALYYTYFRSHPAELASLLVDERYYVSKKEIILFYQKHVRDFPERQNALGFSDKLEKWYSETSAIVHGQVPGKWSGNGGLEDLCHDGPVLEAVVEHFERAVSLVQDAFLCVIGAELWPFVESEAKKFICNGMKGHAKTTLKLDIA